MQGETMLTIDGAIGEGGGQILRSSLTLSLMTGKPFRMIHIRASRKKPGLLRQHLTSVQAAARISGASVVGDRLGSQDLEFSPGQITPGSCQFDVGSAGSATLVLQTILLPLALASGETTIDLSGGTHNPLAPPFEFLDRTFFPVLKAMGARISATLVRPGFYPKGGGRMRITVSPTKRLEPLDLMERGAIRQEQARAIVAGLPRHIADREIRTVAEILGWESSKLQVESLDTRFGPGNVLLLVIASEHITEVFTGFGERGVSAEKVAERVCRQVRRYLDADVPVGEHLADQMLLPLAIAGSGRFRTLPLTPHTMTNIAVIERFLDVRVVCEPASEKSWVVQLERQVR
jgi:RNA 3'-terminal phosphate cyclase (ATP)